MAVVFFVKRTSIIGYFSDQDQPISMIVPPTAMSDMEIVDEKEFAAAVGKSFISVKAHQGNPAIVIFADELCFSQKISGKDEPNAVAGLSRSVPFARVVTTKVQLQDTSMLIAANADLCETIVGALAEKGYPVALVIPWVAVVQTGISKQGEFDRVSVRHVFDAQSTLKTMSFPCETMKTVETVPTEHTRLEAAKKRPVGWYIFGGFALLYAMGMLVYLLRNP